MNRLVNLAPRVSQQVTRQLSATCIARKDENVVDISKLKENQKKFQIEDGKPVHLKGGFFDQILYFTTLGLCVVGLGYAGNMLIGMTKK